MGEKWQPSGVITLTTDFGIGSAFVGMMQGVIISHFPAAKIVNLFHKVGSYMPEEAGFWLQHSYQYFPEGSIHVAVVDPGVGTDRNIIIAQSQGHLFLAPDNGLLAEFFNRTNPEIVYRLENKCLQALNLGQPSATFHGRDIFAPLAAMLAAGKLQPPALGSPVSEWQPSALPAVEVVDGVTKGIIISTDRFGNLITNIEACYLDAYKHPQVYAASRVFDLKRTYGDARQGEFIALVNSLSVIELAQVQGSAKGVMQVHRGASVIIREAEDD